MMETEIDVGRALKTLRRHETFTLKQISKSIGLSQSYLVEIENGQKRINIEVLARVSSFFNLLPSDILKLAENIARKDSGKRASWKYSKKIQIMLSNFR